MKKQRPPFSFHLNNKQTLVVVDWFNLWNKNKDLEPKPLFDYLKTYSEIYQVRFYNGLIESKEHSQRTIDKAREVGYEVVSKKSKLQPIDIREADHFQSILQSLDILFKDIQDTNSSISNTLYNHKDSIDGTQFDIFSDIDSKLRSVDQNVSLFKEESKKPILKVKCDFDAEIARDIVLQMDDYENLILFSGDGDFASTIKYLISDRRKKVFVIFTRGSFGISDYRNYGLVEMVEKTNKKGKKYYDPISANKELFIFIDFSRIEKAIKQQTPEEKSSGAPDADNVAGSEVKVNLAVDKSNI